MSYTLEQKLIELRPYEPLQGNYRIRLDANESFIPMPQKIIEKFQKEAAGIEYNRYPDPYCAELCAAFSSAYGVPKENITVGNGSDELISLICETFLKDGGKVLTLEPDFSMYSFYTELRRGVNVKYNKNEDFSVDIDKVLEIIKKEKIDLMIFSNPCNPTGKIIKRDDVLRLVKNAPCLVVLDEAYMDFSDQTALAEVGNYNNLIVLRTMSKAYASAALRIGFAVAGAELTKVLKSAKSPYNVNAVSQALGRIILSDKDNYRNAVKAIIASKGELFAGLRELKTVLNAQFEPLESETNFLFVKTAKADEIFKRLLSDGIAVRRLEQGLRINAGSKEENGEIIKMLRSYK